MSTSSHTRGWPPKGSTPGVIIHPPKPNTTRLEMDEGYILGLLDWMYSLHPGFGFETAPDIKLDGFLRAALKSEPHSPETQWLFRVDGILIRVRVRRELRSEAIPGDPLPIEIELSQVGRTTSSVVTMTIRRPEMLLVNLRDFATLHGKVD